MEYITGACTDIGSVRDINQDAVCIMQAQTAKGNVCMVIVCDGLGGLSKGELASATVIRAFERVFMERLPGLLEQCTLEQLKTVWEKELFYWNDRLKEYGMRNQLLLGTTFSGMLFIEDKYFWVHVGDSRIYRIGSYNVEQMTTDHTVVARELAKGTMTPEEAAHSKLKNRLTQCIGASKILELESGIGIVENSESFLICSDGFYHKFKTEEILEINSNLYSNDHALDRFCQNATEKVMERGEKDNVSVVVLKCN